MKDIIIFIVLFVFFLAWLLYAVSKRKKENERKQAEIKARNDASRKAHEEQMKQLEEERRAREAKWARIQEEQDRKIAERDAAYQQMLDNIQPVPIVATEEKAKKIAISFLNTLPYSTVTVRSNMEQLSNYVVIDTETTGLKVVSDEIIEVAAIRFRGFEPTEKFVTLLSPSKPIPERITALNHITDEMVAGKPCFQQIAQALVEFIGDDNIVGHNLPFDLKFIVHYGANVTEKKRKYYDTLELARKTDRGASSYKLSDLYGYFGLPRPQTLHRAEADAMGAGLLFQKLIDIRSNRK